MCQTNKYHCKNWFADQGSSIPKVKHGITKLNKVDDCNEIPAVHNPCIRIVRGNIINTNMQRDSKPAGIFNSDTF